MQSASTEPQQENQTPLYQDKNLLILLSATLQRFGEIRLLTSKTMYGGILMAAMVVYSHVNFTGKESEVQTHDRANVGGFWNDQISSIKIMGGKW